jgi:hypothetical protein
LVRSCFIVVRVSVEEDKLIDRNMLKRGYDNVSEYVRLRLLVDPLDGVLERLDKIEFFLRKN